jgi:GcrA cell cycle regulator
MPHASSDFDWNDQAVVRLRSLWADGHSTAEIGRRLGVSKNAIVSKAHRLDLPARPSPIRPARSGKPRPARRPRCPRLADPMPLRSVSAEPTQPKTAHILPRIDAPVVLGKLPCCWPIGQPRTLSFRVCERPNQAGKPYCPEYCRVAYQKPSAGLGAGPIASPECAS